MKTVHSILENLSGCSESSCEHRKDQLRQNEEGRYKRLQQNCKVILISINDVFKGSGISRIYCVFIVEL